MSNIRYITNQERFNTLEEAKLASKEYGTPIYEIEYHF